MADWLIEWPINSLADYDAWWLSVLHGALSTAWWRMLKFSAFNMLVYHWDACLLFIVPSASGNSQLDSSHVSSSSWIALNDLQEAWCSTVGIVQ